MLPEAPPVLRWFAHRFAPGEATLWVGPPRSVDTLLEFVYAGNALARGRISLIEGANRFHPYRIGERGRALGVDPTNVLERIRLARAFTAYQLVALVEAWASEARRRRPTLLIAHELPALFYTDEVPREEREPLLRHVAERLALLTREVSAPLLLTLNEGFTQFPGLREAGPRFFDLITFTPRSETLQLRAYRDDARLALVPRPPGQHGIDEFVSDPQKEVMAWDAPRRRTVRRSKNG